MHGDGLSASELHRYTRDGMLPFLNPVATQQELGELRVWALQQALGVSAAGFAEPLYDLPEPKHVQDTPAKLVYSHGGDGTVNAVMSAILGVVPNNPEATALNALPHAEIARNVLYVAGAGGYANNFPISALGAYARTPLRIEGAADLAIGTHFPLYYYVTSRLSEVMRSGIVTSGIGLNTTAAIVRRFQEQKADLAKLGRTRRLGREAAATLGALLTARPFAAEITLWNDRDSIREHHTDLTGFELVGSRRYARVVRTGITVDDTMHQPIVTRHREIAAGQAAGTLAALMRSVTGRHALRPLDFAGNVSLDIRLTQDEPIPFHVDGETGEGYTIMPGQTLHLWLGNTPVNTLLRRP